MTVTASPHEDARIIAQGIRLGGSREIVSALDAALLEGPLTPDRIEQAAHPDWDRLRYEEIRDAPTPGSSPCPW